MTLRAVPLPVKVANRLVAAWHRHRAPTHHALWGVGACLPDGRLVGAAIVSLPQARELAEADPLALEVRRCVTDGTPNANSFLHATCWKVARALGCRRLLTYARSRTRAGAS